MSNRLDQESERTETPKRIKYAQEQIEALGYKVMVIEPLKAISFAFNQEVVTFYPYSGWATGKSIIDGRGIAKLLKQIK